MYVWIDIMKGYHESKHTIMSNGIMHVLFYMLSHFHGSTHAHALYIFHFPPLGKCNEWRLIGSIQINFSLSPTYYLTPTGSIWMPGRWKELKQRLIMTQCGNSVKNSSYIARLLWSMMHMHCCIHHFVVNKIEYEKFTSNQEKERRRWIICSKRPVMLDYGWLCLKMVQ